MFEKLIEAARTCYESGNPIDECCIEDCPNFDSQPYCLDQILKDCVEALTQSGAELKDKDYLIQQQADEIERLRRDVKKQQEKMIELAKELPKRGQYVHGRELSREYIGDCLASIDYEYWRCSVCGIVFEQWSIPKYNYCPNCGAKMEVQE